MLRLACIAEMRTCASERSFPSLRIRKMRKERMTRRDCAPGTSKLRIEGRMESRSTTPKKLTKQSCTQVCVYWEMNHSFDSALPEADDVKGTPELNVYLTERLTKDSPSVRVETVDGVIVREDHLK